MAEKRKDDKNTLEERANKALSDALAKELGEIPEVSITVKELKELEKASRKKKRGKLTKFVSVAAVAVVVCAAVVYLAWPESMVPVDADKNTEQRVQQGDGVVIINEGQAEGDGAQIWTETKWNKIDDLRNEFDGLCDIVYVPKDYKFKKLVIEEYKDNGYNAKYFFMNNNKTLQIEQEVFYSTGSNTGFTNGKETKVPTKNGDVYIIYPKDKNEATIGVLYTDKNIIKVSGSITEKELKKIFDEIELP